MPMRLRSQSRQTRQYHRTQLPKCMSGTDSESESESDFDIESDGSQFDNNNEEEASILLPTSTAIPELDINEIIQLANQIINNNHIPTTSSGTTENDSNIHIRFPLIRSINEARDIILRHEQQRADDNNTNNNNSLSVSNDDIIWNSIIEDESGISISGTRRQHVETNEENIRNMEDVHIHRQPVWLEIAGLITVTMFMFAVYRLVTTLVAISAFSDNVLQDVIEFVDYVNEKTYYTEYATTTATITKDLSTSTITPESTTLIKKFAMIIKKEMPYLPDTIWLAITVAIFSGYTIFTSGIVLTSMLFSMMCLSMCCVIRWRHLGDFIVRVINE